MEDELDLGDEDASRRRKVPYEKRFEGRDRRLYWNKAMCEMEMGLFELSEQTIKEYVTPVKKLMRKLVAIGDKHGRAKNGRQGSVD